MKLNRTGSNWNELERNKINENWDMIEDETASLGNKVGNIIGEITDEAVEQIIDSAKVNWREPVNTFDDLPEEADEGDTRMVREVDPDGLSYVYRYDGESWVKIQEIDATLVNEVDKRFAQQLAEIVTNINNFKHLVVDGDWSPAIKEASQSNTIVLFPTNNVYTIKSHLKIDGVSNLSWRMHGSLIYDDGKEVMLENGKITTTAVGIRFVECDNLNFFEVTHDGNTRSNGAGRIAEDEIKNIVPQVDFYNCTNTYLNDFKIKGLANPWGTGRLDIPGHDASTEMQWHYVRFLKCKNTKLERCGLLTGGGAGEIFSFAESEYIDIIEPFHFQGDAHTTFWSFVNAIGCKHVNIREPRIQSESTGSFMDIAGENITCEGFNIDYPNGKLMDITQEWGYGNVPTSKFVLKDSEANVERLAFVSKGESVNLKTIDELVLDNIRSTKENFSNPFITCDLIKKTIIKNLDINNVPYVNEMNVFEDQPRLEQQEVLIENCKITSDTQVRNNHTTIETRGITKVQDCYINLNRKNYLSLRERQINHTDLKNSKNKIVFRNTNFENTRISFDANVYFYDCEFINCDFVFERRVNVSNPSVYFLNCGDIYFNNVDYTDLPTTNIPLFNLSSSGSSFGTIHLKNTNIIGKTTSGVFSGLDNKMGKILLDNSKVNIERWDADRTTKRRLRDSIIFMDFINNEKFTTDITIVNSNIKGTLMRLEAGAGGESPFSIQLVDSIFYNLESNGSAFYSITRDSVNGSYNRTKLRIKGCTFNSNNINYLDESTNFSEKSFSQNTQNFILD